MLDKNKQIKETPPMLSASVEIPETVYLQIIADNKNLIARVVRAEDEHGFRVGAGYIDSVSLSGDDRIVTVRLIIRNRIYEGELNWDKTRFCKISLVNHNLEVVL